jgi:membrane fusion protein, heavy metal efflux system
VITHASPIVKLASVAVVMTALAATMAACSPGRGVGALPASSNEAARKPPTPQVDLSSGQLEAIRVEPAGTRPFSVEREAVGSISFDEDVALVQAESTLIAAAATFDLTRKELARVQSLGESNGIAPKELEQAVSDHQTAAAALKAARDAVRALGKTDEQIDRIQVSGKFTSSSSGHAPLTWVLASVNETDSPLLRVGQSVQVRPLAFPDRVFAGQVFKVYATVDPNNHHVPVRAQIKDPQGLLRPGMLASVTIRIGTPAESIAIPTTAAMREGDGMMMAWVTTDRRRFTPKVLQLGLQADGYYQVLQGLQKGELVVTEGGVFLSNLLEAPPPD